LQSRAVFPFLNVPSLFQYRVTLTGNWLAYGGHQSALSNRHMRKTTETGVSLSAVIVRNFRAVVVGYLWPKVCFDTTRDQGLESLIRMKY